ncbi:MAG: hypothetical protein V1816_28450 [Pseudomonadota bacterium]
MNIRVRLLAALLALFPLLFFSCGPDEEEGRHPEKFYQEIWCREQGGRREARLADRTRCDCLTSTHAVEFDFGPKWAEALGQSLHYSVMTGKKAGVVLILEGPDDKKYLDRLRRITAHFEIPVDFWIMRPPS